MKYQNFAIIFVLILLPIAIVLENYIQTQTDTLSLITNYQTKLTDSTYDAIAAYQMNSLNTQQVTGESVKSYVLASVNTFFTTLATNMGMSSASKNLLLPYIPAILFTTYDGYYIYSPTKTNTIATIPGGSETDPDASDAGQAVMTEEGNLIFLTSGTERVTRSNTEGNNEISYSKIQNKSNADFATISKATINPNANDVNYNYMVKPFIYYSANYKDGNNYNFVASYTLDNYITVYGTKRNNRDTKVNGTTPDDYITNEFSKSGYLIDTKNIDINGDLLIKGVKRNDRGYSLATSDKYDELLPSSNTEASKNTTYFKVGVNISKGTDLTGTSEIYNLINYFNYKEGQEYNNGYYISKRTDQEDTNDEPNIRMQTGDQIIEDTLEIEQLINENPDYQNLIDGQNYSSIQVTYKNQTIEDPEAKEYYIKAYFFSEWVQNNLSDVKAETFQKNITDTNEVAFNTSFGEEKIFDIKGQPENDPESNTSIIAQHKRDIIKNSIQYNLNSAISTYNKSHNGVAEDYKLPILTEKDWDSILNNVCMVSFMQGIPCGTQIFNDYAVVKSNNNNTTVSLENMYFTTDIGDTPGEISNFQYHKIDCEKLTLDDGRNIYEADQSATFKYDALKLNTRIDESGGDEKIICFYDDSTNTYYEAEKIVAGNGRNIDNLSVGEKITTECAVDGITYPIKSDDPTNKRVLSLLPTGSDVKYLYDHKNEGCYECIISGNYEPKVKYYNGEIYATYITEYKEILLWRDDLTTPGWYYEDGVEYDTGDGNGTNRFARDPNIPIGLGNNGVLTETELQKRRKSVYTYIAKIRNGLYKTNSHINR